MLADALEHLVRGIVDNPDDVEVSSRRNRRGDLLKIRVHPDDLGRVIGRNGRTAKSLRSVVNALADQSVRVDVIETDR
ncbi:RNA-binding protein [Arcanobacterium canis]